MKCCSICNHLAVIAMSNYGPPIRRPSLVWGLGLTVENATNLNVVPTFLHATSVHTIGLSILHRLATIHNAADSQTIGSETNVRITERDRKAHRLWLIGNSKI